MTARVQVILLAGLLMFVGLWDFFQRVHVSRHPVERRFDLAGMSGPKEPVSLAEVEARLQTWLSQPELGQTAGGIAGERADEPLSGSRRADRGELGGVVFVLRGVFDDGSPFAVLEVQVPTAAAAEVLRVSEGDRVHGATITMVSGSVVELGDGTGTIRLAMFKGDRQTGSTRGTNEQ